LKLTGLKNPLFSPHFSALSFFYSSASTAGEVIGLDSDISGGVYFTDQTYMTIRYVSQNGTLTRFAGMQGGGTDVSEALATSAQFRMPFSVRADNAGSVYIG
jgi:hypothetical protein